MSILSFPPVAFALGLMYALVTWLTETLTPFTAAAAPLLAVIALTLAIRAALLPLAVRAGRGDVARRRLAPQIDKLRRRYSADPARLQKEVAALYQREHVSPFGALVPLLVQAPLLGLVYAVFTQPSIAGAPNGVLAHQVFGAPLGTSMASVLGAGTATIPTIAFFGILLAVAAVAAELARRRMSRLQTTPATGVMRALGALPYLSVVFAVLVPLAASVYLATSSMWGSAERLILDRLLA